MNIFDPIRGQREHNIQHAYQYVKNNKKIPVFDTNLQKKKQITIFGSRIGTNWLRNNPT